MPWKKIKKNLRRIRKEIEKQRAKNKFEEYVVIFRKKGRHYSENFWTKKGQTPDLISKLPSFEIIETHKAKHWPPKKIIERLQRLDAMVAERKK